MTDGAFLPDRLGKEQKRPSKVIILAVVLVAILIVGAVAWVTVRSVSHPSNHTRHESISIVGNGEFTRANGVTSGSGTASDPYIIADWDINMSAAGGDGILVQDAVAHFTVRNCHVHGANGYSGIHLSHCVDGNLENNTLLYNLMGIDLSSSRNITLIDNKCSGGGYGIYLSSSSNNNTLTNNICIAHVYNCIYLLSSNNNTLNNNKCIGQSIHLDSSSYNNILNNNCSNNQVGIVLDSVSNDNTLTENTCSSDYNIGIALDSSSNNTLNGNDCSNITYGSQSLSEIGVYGIYLSSSSNSTLINNNCSNDYDGIYLHSSRDNTLSNNNCSSNDHAGIDLFQQCNSNTLSSNNCSSDGHRGIIIEQSSRNSLRDNNCSSDGADGIYLGLLSSNNEVSHNLVRNNAGYGVIIDYSTDYPGSNNRIWNNTFIGDNGATGTYDSSRAQAFDGGAHNWWNSTEGYGNYWSDWTTPDAVPPWGVVDHPYDISGSAGAKDYYPLTTS